MSRNNVFKLSGNMALGSNDPYGNANDFDNIKSSLKLLKSKQQGQGRQNMPLDTNVYLFLIIGCIWWLIFFKFAKPTAPAKQK